MIAGDFAQCVGLPQPFVHHSPRGIVWGARPGTVVYKSIETSLP
jgi:hypothetical protein